MARIIIDAGADVNVRDNGGATPLHWISILISDDVPTEGLEAYVKIVKTLIEKGANTIGIKAPVTRETVDKYTEDIAVDGSLIQKELGFVPQYDLKAGWEETIKEMRGKDSFKF